MTGAWINLSTRWGLTSAQAALNVFISVLGTVGIWSFSRYWWQRSANTLRGNGDVNLSGLLTLSGPGESWDVVTVLRRQVFAKENWHLLIQIIVVLVVTLTCMFAGPIAKVSLRNISTVQKDQLEVLQTVKGDGFSANLETATELWNETIRSLDNAVFPTDQLLDYLPPSTADWIYVATEWNPTWRMACVNTEETILHNVIGTGDGTFYDAVNAFPVYRDTFNPAWFDSSKFRIQQDFDNWADNDVAHLANTTNHFVTAAYFFTLAQSDPLVDDRMEANNDTLQMSISVLHAKNFYASNYSDTSEGGARVWRPVGPVENASFSRVECNITRKPHVLDENKIPWIWTNDTYDITMGYAQYWMYHLEEYASKDIVLSPPTPKELLRFYQVYFATANTIYASPTLRSISMWKDTVQLSVVFLVIMVALACLTILQSGRYLLFLRRHKSQLGELSIPDGKLGWMVYGARVSKNDRGELIDDKKAKDRDHLKTAIFGYSNVSNVKTTNTSCRAPGLARIYTSRGTIQGASPSKRGSEPLRITIHEDGNLKTDQPSTPTGVEHKKTSDVGIVTVENDSHSNYRNHSLVPTGKILRPQITTNLSSGGPSSQCGSSSPRSSFHTIVGDAREPPPQSKARLLLLLKINERV